MDILRVDYKCLGFWVTHDATLLQCQVGYIDAMPCINSDYT